MSASGKIAQPAVGRTGSGVMARKRRRAANKRPTLASIHAQHAIVAAHNAGTVHAPDRMTTER
jgi:hypothetical protein